MECIQGFNLNYPAINAKRPAMNITTIAIHNSHTVKTGNIRKRIRKIMANPTSDPPVACCFSTIFFHPRLINNP